MQLEGNLIGMTSRGSIPRCVTNQSTQYIMTPKEMREQIQVQAKKYALHSKLAHERRNEILNNVPEHEREAMRGLLGQFADYVRFSDAAQQKIFMLKQQLKDNE